MPRPWAACKASISPRYSDCFSAVTTEVSPFEGMNSLSQLDIWLHTMLGLATFRYPPKSAAGLPEGAGVPHPDEASQSVIAGLEATILDVTHEVLREREVAVLEADRERAGAGEREEIARQDRLISQIF